MHDDGPPAKTPRSAAEPSQSTPRFGQPTPFSTLSLGGLAAALIAIAAVLIFGFLTPWGYLPLIAGVALGFAASRPLGRDLGLVALSLGIVSTISVEANIEWPNFFLMGAVLTAAVVVPYIVHRALLRDDAIRYPRRRGEPWSKLEWGWLAFVLLAGWFILPRYFIHSGTYQNWPAVESPSEVGRLFVGVNGVGIWDELFFICMIFTLLARHFPFWTANVLTSIIFVSFLWELGYRSWGPLLHDPVRPGPSGRLHEIALPAVHDHGPPALRLRRVLLDRPRSPPGVAPVLLVLRHLVLSRPLHSCPNSASTRRPNLLHWSHGDDEDAHRRRVRRR